MPTLTINDVIIEKEKSAWEAAKNHDVYFYRRLLTDDCISVVPSGVYNKEITLKAIARRAAEYLSYDFEDPKVLPLSDNAALLTYKISLDVQLKGQLMHQSIYTTSVYVNTGDDWKVKFFQQTPAKQ